MPLFSRPFALPAVGCSLHRFAFLSLASTLNPNTLTHNHTHTSSHSLLSIGRRQGHPILLLPLLSPVFSSSNHLGRARRTNHRVFVFSTPLLSLSSLDDLTSAVTSSASQIKSISLSHAPNQLNSVGQLVNCCCASQVKLFCSISLSFFLVLYTQVHRRRQTGRQTSVIILSPYLMVVVMVAIAGKSLNLLHTHSQL